MNYLLLVIGPHKNAMEAWIPHWFSAESPAEAHEKAKEIAFTIYESEQYPPERYRFELFRRDSILPAVLTDIWLEEYKSQKT